MSGLLAVAASRASPGYCPGGSSPGVGIGTGGHSSRGTWTKGSGSRRTRRWAAPSGRRSMPETQADLATRTAGTTRHRDVGPERRRLGRAVRSGKGKGVPMLGKPTVGIAPTTHAEPGRNPAGEGAA
jgi:hypothetical protein